MANGIAHESVDVLARIVCPDAEQKRLTDCYILPYREEILADLLHLRHAIDILANELARKKFGEPLGNLKKPDSDGWKHFYDPVLERFFRIYLGNLGGPLKNFPIGRCTELSIIAYRYILSNDSQKVGLGLDKLREFKAEGGEFNIIWGSIRNLYFQNAFQVGTEYFDISNDTVDLTKPKVDHASLEKSGFKNFDTIGEYALIKEKYQKVSLFLNDCFPNLYPFFPLFVMGHPNKVLELDENPYFLRLAIAEECFEVVYKETVERAYFKSIDSVLAEQDLSEISRINGVDKLSAHPFYFRKMSVDERLTKLRELDRTAPDEVMRVFHFTRKMALHLNQTWKAQNFYERIVDINPDISKPST